MREATKLCSTILMVQLYNIIVTGQETFTKSIPKGFETREYSLCKNARKKCFTMAGLDELLTHIIKSKLHRAVKIPTQCWWEAKNWIALLKEDNLHYELSHSPITIEERPQPQKFCKYSGQIVKYRFFVVTF